MKLILLLSSFLVASFAFGQTINWDTKTTYTIIEADRQSDVKYRDLFLIRFLDENGATKTCDGISHAYIENSTASHNSIVSMSFFLAAQDKMATLKLDIGDMKGVAARIEYMMPKQ